MIRATTHRALASQLMGWLNIVFGIVIMVCLGTVYSWSVFRMAVEQHFKIGATLSGLPYLVSLAVYAVSMLFSGRLLDRKNPRSMVLVGGLLVGLGWILSSYARSIFAVALSFGVITGAGVGIVYGVPIAIAARWFPRKNGVMLGLVLVGFGLSPLFTAPLADYLISAFGLLSAFRLLGISFILLIPFLSLPIQNPPNYGKRAGLLGQGASGSLLPKEILSRRGFKGIYLSFMIGTMIGLLLIGMTNSIGMELFGLSSASTAMLMSVFAVFNGAGRPFFGWLVGRLSIKKSMLLSYALIFTAALLILLVKSQGGALLFALTFSVFWFNLGGWLAIAPAATLALFGQEHYGRNYGIIFTAYGFGAVIGVISSGLVRDFFRGYDAVFVLVAALCITGIWVSQRLLDSEQKS
jgi:MFS family permease